MTESYSERVAREVRAEMARQRKTSVDLAPVIGRSQQTASNRMRGLYPFNVDEIEAVAEWLAVPMETFTAANAVASAA